jgi:hypothetical protein
MLPYILNNTASPTTYEEAAAKYAPVDDKLASFP